MNQLPLELQQALQHQRLLVVWGDLPFELPPCVIGERAAVVKRLLAEAAQLPALRTRLSVTPPLPILSLDPTDRIEREFGGRSLKVLLTRRDVPAARLHNLIKLAGDLDSRAGLVLSREEVQHLREDEDKRYLLDLVRSITEKDSAVILVGCDPASAGFQAWWSVIRLALGSAPIFAAGEPSGVWPEEVTYLGTVQDVVNAAFANVKAPIPQVESAGSFDVLADTTSATTRSGGVDVQAGQVEIGGDVVGRDKVVSAGGHIIHAETGATVIINETPPAPEPASGRAVMPIEVQTLRVDAAVPEQVYVDRVFDLAVAVRQMTSPPLVVKDLEHVESGEVQTTWEKGTPLINLRAEVESPDCEISGKSSIPFRLVRGNDSPLLRFQLKPLRAGELSLVVTVYQEDYWLGSARVNTVAAEQTTQPAGKVQITLTSQPLDALPVPSETVDVAVLTVLPEEYNALCSQFASLRPPVGGAANLYAWQIGAVPCPRLGGAYTIAVGMQGRAGTPLSALAAADAIQRWKPRYVFFVGIAGGLSGLNRGDVVIADVVYGYEYGKVEQVFMPRDNWTTKTDLGLLTGATAYALRPDWRERITARPPAAGVPQVVAGEVVSGDKVIDDPTNAFFAEILKRWPKAKAVEMEGAGVGAAIEQAQALGLAVGFTMIRGISDLPRPQQTAEVRGAVERDNWKPYASGAAAAFTIGWIEHGLPEKPRAPTLPIEAPQPLGRKPLSTEDRESLERQLKSARENLRLIEERKAEFVLETDVPLQIVKEQRRLTERITELERKLSGG